MEVAINEKADIEEISRLGNYQVGKNRPILVKLTRSEKKIEIFKHK